MGYQLHITRRENWFDKEGANIDFEDWESVVAADSELQSVDHAEVLLSDGQILQVKAPGMTRWVGHPNFEEAWLLWSGGNISCKNPDDAIIDKMISLASQLQARVQGDEGEFYKNQADD